MNSVSTLKMSEAIPLMKEISNQYGLKLWRPNEFKLAKMLLINLYFNHFDFNI
jgi:hypothetical protein